MSIPLLADLIERETVETIDLSNRITIEVLTASFRTVRGRTIVASLNDEIAFWRTDEDTANPDSEIIGALRPAMATVPGAVILKASSPYAQRGVLWDDYQKHFGKDTATLVWQAATRTMNSTVPQSFIDRRSRKTRRTRQPNLAPNSEATSKPSSAARSSKPHDERPIRDSASAGCQILCMVRSERRFCGLMTLAIASKEGEKVVLHAIREAVPPLLQV